MAEIKPDNDTFGRVLSIQSHCVHSIVGNRSAVFALQTLGFDVDPINSVQFSNHTGYLNGFRGQVLAGDQLDQLIQGLRMNGILSTYTHLLTGFVHSISVLEKVSFFATLGNYSNSFVLYEKP